MGRRGPAAVGAELPIRPVPYPQFDGTQHCLGIGVEAFFPNGSNHEQNTYVKQACTGCPLLEQCREYAVSYDVLGVWAGTTYAERRRIRARLGIRPIPLSSDDDMAAMLAALDTGHLPTEEIAIRAGCSTKTVERYRIRRRGEAA